MVKSSFGYLTMGVMSDNMISTGRRFFIHLLWFFSLDELDNCFITNTKNYPETQLPKQTTRTELLTAGPNS